MDGRQLQARRRRLEDLRWMMTREYWKERERVRQEGRETAEDLVDLATRSYARDYLVTLGERERVQLLAIEDALARIAAGRYGVCTTCDHPIPAERLDAVPWTTCCVGCQERIERSSAENPAWESGAAA